MNRWLKRYNARCLHRKQLSLERWAEIRAKGRRQFVLSQAFSFAVFMTAFRDVFNHFYEDDSHLFNLGFYIVQYAITGIIVGYVSWGDREGKYKNAQLNGRLQTSFDDRIKPH